MDTLAPVGRSQTGQKRILRSAELTILLRYVSRPTRARTGWRLNFHLLAQVAQSGGRNEQHGPTTNCRPFVVSGSGRDLSRDARQCLDRNEDAVWLGSANTGRRQSEAGWASAARGVHSVSVSIAPWPASILARL